MIVRNIRKDMAYKADKNILMLNNLLYNLLNVDNRIFYSVVANFDNGIDINNIYELMEPKGWTREIINENIEFLISMGLIESVIHNVDLEKINGEFEKFKATLK